MNSKIENKLWLRAPKLGVPTLMLALLLLLTGCDSTSSESLAATELKWRKIDIDYGKPSAPVVEEYGVAEELAPGQVFPVEMLFTSNTPAGTMEISLNAEGDLTLLSPAQAEFSLADPDKRIVVNLDASQNGLSYLNVNVLERDEQGSVLQGKSFSIPLQIGDVSLNKALPAEQKMKRDGEELIIEMPAETNQP